MVDFESKLPHQQLLSDTYWQGMRHKPPKCRLLPWIKDTINRDETSSRKMEQIQKMYEWIAIAHGIEDIHPGETLPIPDKAEPVLLKVVVDSRIRYRANPPSKRVLDVYCDADEFDNTAPMMTADPLFRLDSVRTHFPEEQAMVLRLARYYRGTSSGAYLVGLLSEQLGDADTSCALNTISAPTIVGEVYADRWKDHENLQKIVSAQLLWPELPVRA